MPGCCTTGRPASTWSRPARWPIRGAAIFSIRRSCFRWSPTGAQTLIDLGSGAGFPGLVLAIMGMPGVELVESDARKCVFLREAARVAGAAVTIRNARIETVPARPISVVTARGVATLDRLLSYSQRFIGPETVCVFPKGEQAAQELAVAQREWDFDVTSHPSRTDPRGVILCLSGSRRRERGQ